MADVDVFIPGDGVGGVLGDIAGFDHLGDDADDLHLGVELSFFVCIRLVRFARGEAIVGKDAVAFFKSRVNV